MSVRPWPPSRLPTTMYHSRKSLHKQYEEMLRESYSEVFKTTIPNSIEFPEAVAHRTTITKYKPRGAAAKAMRSLAGEIYETLSKEQHDGISGRDDQSRAKNLVELEIGRIIRDAKQPRESFPEAELEQLADSIKARGMLQPIRVRWEAPNYVLVSGERRYRAAQLAGLKTVPCVIKDGVASEAEILQDQLVENLLRQDLEPIEAAKAYRRLLDLEGISIRELARMIHVSDASIVRALSLLELPESVQEKVRAGELAPSVAYEVSKAPPEDREALAEKVVKERIR